MTVGKGLVGFFHFLSWYKLNMVTIVAVLIQLTIKKIKIKKSPIVDVTVKIVIIVTIKNVKGW